MSLQRQSRRVYRAREAVARQLWRRLRLLSLNDAQPETIAATYRQLTDIMALIEDRARLAVGGTIERGRL